MKRSKPMSRGTMPERKPARQWEGPAPRPRIVPARAANDSVIALAFAMPPLEPAEAAATTAAGRRHMGRVAALGCVLCRLRGFGFVAAEVHHVRAGQGGAQRAPDFLSLPACPDCHRGEHGIHGDRGRLRAANVIELDLLAETLALLFEGIHV